MFGIDLKFQKFFIKTTPNIMSFLEVKITRCDSSKQERKVIKVYYQRLKLLRKIKLHEEKGTYISQVYMYFGHDALFSSLIDWCLTITSRVVHFTALPIFF